MTIEANAGATPAVTGETAGTPTSTTNAQSATPAPSKPMTHRQAMAIRFSEAKAAQEASAKVSTTPTEDAAPSDGADLRADVEAPEAETPSDTSPDDTKSDNNKEPDSIPLKAFKERLAREAKKREELQTQLAAKDLEVRNHAAAIELLKQEYERLLEAQTKGLTYDEKDERISALEFERKAKELQAKALEEHKKALEEQRRQAELAERKAQVKQEFARVLDVYGDLVSGHELKAAAKKVWTRNPDVPLEDIAKLIHGQRLEKAKAKVKPVEEPPAPKLVKPGNGQAAGYEFTPDAKGIQAWLRAQREAGQRQ